jgi:hypothetical protein
MTDSNIGPREIARAQKILGVTADGIAGSTFVEKAVLWILSSVSLDYHDRIANEAQRQIQVLEVQTGQIRALHVPYFVKIGTIPGYGGLVCTACHQVYPCPTMQALGVTE